MNYENTIFEKTYGAARKALIVAAVLATAWSGNAGAQAPRRVISSENPLFVYSSAYAGAKPSQAANFWRVLPEDVKPYFGIHVNAKKEDSQENRDWIVSILEQARELGAPAIIEVEGFATDNDTPMEYWEELFDEYPNLIGLNISEISATGGLSGSALDQRYMEKIAKYIETCAKHGGYFIWQDMAWDWPFKKAPHVFVKAGAKETLYDAVRQYGANVVFTHKHNGNGRRFTSDAAAMGFWASGLTAAWGVHSEGWLWWEAGYERLYQPSVGHERSKESWKSVFTYPEALYGTEWLIGAAGGASLFSLEAYFQGYSTCDGSAMTPAFEYVVLPTIRKIIGDGLIATKEEALSKIKVAYHPGEAAPRALQEDHLFTGLYGPSETTEYEWLPSTGRYYFIPIIPALADKSVDEKFAFVIDDEYYGKNLVKTEKKKELFDKYYPSVGSGDSWLVNVGDHWYFANPNENTDITTTFEFAPVATPGMALSGKIGPHTFGTVKEKDGGLRIYINNYRTDKGATVWENKLIEEGKTCDFVSETTKNPPDEELRESVIAVAGKGPEELKIDVEFGRRGSFSVDGDGAGGTVITLSHNGPADIAINL